MLLQLILFFLLIILIYLIVKKSVKYFFQFVFQISRRKHLSVWIIALTFLPGTIVHELSHFLMATILRVPTGSMTIFPTFEKNGEVKAGRLMVGHAYPFRLSLIGLAPMFAGIACVWLAGIFLIGDVSMLLKSENFIFKIMGFIALFQITSGMFSSKRDLKSFVMVLPILLLLLLAGHLSGLSIEANQRFIDSVSSYLAKLNIYLSIAAAIDLLVYLFLSLGKKLQQDDVRR